MEDRESVNEGGDMTGKSPTGEDYEKLGEERIVCWLLDIFFWF
jgi:hypothetical protein